MAIGLSKWLETSRSTVRSGRVRGGAGLILALALLMVAPGAGRSAENSFLSTRISDVSGTKHNLSATGPGTVRASSEDEICVFCHTPHSANSSLTPLWNRAESSATYTPYTSTSYDAQSFESTGLGVPGGSSKLCLSCHDGTIAIGNVSVLDGRTASSNIAMNNVYMPGGEGDSTGFTRKLGTDLTNDHPISFTYSSDLATRDGELRDPAGSTHIDSRAVGLHPQIPLEGGKVQCATCHDPHIRDPGGESIKFLRWNRFQTQDPASFDIQKDIICLACHNKDGWVGSAHANQSVANEVYTGTASGLRDFPSGIAVWEAACLNCHDTHTVQGARRLLREGTDSLSSPKSGGNSAIEETCYQCHSANSILTNSTQVPDVEQDFSDTYAMPIKITTETHDIGILGTVGAGADFLEDPTKLGTGSRHTECTDCHNPHRVIKNRLFNANPSTPDAAGTHSHSTGHTNIASGVLKGAWGVEPNYPAVSGPTSFTTLPSSYTVKRGNPAVSALTTADKDWVTREYQICFKCHSKYAYGSTPPNLGCCTPSGTNNLTQYTDQSMEFFAPDADRGEPGGNHRSWHPVMLPTGRSASVRGSMTASFWLSPWSNDLGTQTMYCSDCHGSETAFGTAAPSGGEDGNPWGPHGSAKAFILKGYWGSSTGTSGRDGLTTADTTRNDLCFKCHSSTRYGSRNGGGTSGFGGSADPNLHAFHVDKIGRLRCTWCHIAIPHGWKNKAFLVNLNDVGPEVGLTAGTQVRNNTTAVYNRAPYYLNSILKIRTWRRSGAWTVSDCGSKGSPGNGESGRTWMRDGNENCKSPP